MQNNTVHLLRFSLGLTFVFVSVMIFQDPLFWAGFIDPWALKLIPFSPVAFMTATAVVDLLIGLCLIINRFVWIAAAVGTLHLLGVLMGSGIDTVTVRDIGLLGATAALTLMTIPSKFLPKKKVSTEPAPDLQSLIKSQEDTV